MNHSWILFREGFDECIASGGRKMVMSVEYCTVNIPACASWFIKNGEVDHLKGCANWLVEAKVDLWRTKSDISASWDSILQGAECSSMSRELSVNISTVNPRYGFNDPGTLGRALSTNDKINPCSRQSVLLLCPSALPTYRDASLPCFPHCRYHGGRQQ
jgi:hypothetical protein